MELRLPVMLTVRRFADAYGIPERTVREWCRDGTLVAVKKGNTWFVDMERSFDGSQEKSPQAR